ncbi:DUF6786 family protein [Algibacter sp. AS12]|uniref:DUF6786 family protein n=1 Tax=Algibacter sp. AS12 TaxID=3135773 RepID=UPI00398A8363
MKHFGHSKLRFNLICIITISVFFVGCKSKESENKGIEKIEKLDYISFANDVSFMEDYIEIIQLSDASGKSKVAVSPTLQGRVMTSSSLNNEGRSYGWINRALFKFKVTQAHINVFGGEERFWIGPEGGQYSIFFKKGSEFTLDDWYTPNLIDLEPFNVKKTSTNAVTFSKKATLVNYSGFKFDLGIEREVKVLSTSEIIKDLGVELNNQINVVAYQTTNSLTNIGDANWEKATGLLSVWLLGMFNPSPQTTIVIPYISGDKAELGVPVNDDYFGKVPAERLVVTENVLYFRGDGEFRSKIGLSPKRAKNVLGAYDALSQILTIVKYNKPEEVTDYVNSLWELQDAPYSGDVVNSYNDGPPGPGKKPLGPFYELETSSPALKLKVGETGTHIQMTCHFEGTPKELTKISEKVLGVSISEITNIFSAK